MTDKTNQPITVITNGYDTEKVSTVELDKKFTIAGAKQYLKDSAKEKLNVASTKNDNFIDEIRNDLKNIKKILDKQGG